MKNYHVLDNRGVIQITGDDSSDFLQGLISNNINKAEYDKLIYAMMLSPQGRFLTDYFILKIEGGYLLDTTSYNLPEIIKKLNNYKLRSKVEIADVSGKYRVLASLEKIDSQFSQDPRNKEIGFRKITEDFSQLQIEPFNEYESLRIKLKIPDAQLDFIYDRSFPLEYGSVELNAIDFLKGCYVGQEVTARIFHLGVIRKKLMNLEIHSSEFIPAKGTEITVDNQKIGIVLGVNHKSGLALVNIEDYNKVKGKPLVANNISVNLY
jgi:folate-binding protein YgfZ